MIPEVIQHKGYTVYLRDLCEMLHTCDPALCSETGCCCGCYSIGITPAELERVIGLAPQAEKYATGIAEDDEIFEEGDCETDLELAVNDEGLCNLAYVDSLGRTLCAVHSAAVDLGLDPYKTKPAPCTLWPVMMPESEEKIIAIMEDAYEFPCNKKRDLTGVTRLCDEVAEILNKKISPAFTSELNEIIRKSQLS